MSYIVRNITSKQSDGENVFLNKFINKLTEDSNSIITLKSSNISTYQDNNEVWSIEFYVFGKYILKIYQRATSSTSYNMAYSTNGGTTFNDIHNTSWSVEYLNNNVYELNYLLVENNTCCYFILTKYSTNVLTLDNAISGSNNSDYSSFLFIKKDNMIISYQSQTSSIYYLKNSNSSSTNTYATFDIVESANKCKLNNGLNIESTDRIFYCPKIAKSNVTGGDFIFSCDNDLLDVSYVPLFAKFIINNHRYFSISFNTLIRID